MSCFRIIPAGIYYGGWLAWCMVLSLTAHAASTDLDKDFGNDGKLLATIGATATTFNAVTLQSDGKIVVVGQSSNDTNTQRVITVVRYLPNGQFDTSFGSLKNGIVTESIRASTDTKAMDVALQADGKIVVAAMAQDSTEFIVVRLLPNGTLDTTFAGTGKAITPMIESGKTVEVQSLAIQNDGKIVVAGRREVDANNSSIALVRYTADGSLDTSFGNEGKVITALGTGADEANDVDIQKDGKIIVAGKSFNGRADDAVVVRYQANGTLDNTFGIKGVTTFSLGDGGTVLYALEQQEDGGILVAGSSQNGSYQNFVLARLLSSGILDNSFGNGSGKVVVSFGEVNSEAYSIEIQSDGNILLGGYAEKSKDYPLFALARLSNKGTIDATFGSDGKILTDISPPNAEKITQIELQNDGKIIAIGDSTPSRGNSQGAIVRYLGDPPSHAEINVAQENIIIPTRGSFDFGITSQGISSTKTFTVTNQGTAPLTLIEPIQIISTHSPSVFSSSAHFTLVDDVGNSSTSSTVNANSLVLAAYASASFTVTLDGATVGTYQAVVTFNNTDSDESLYQFTVSGQVSSDKISKLEMWNDDSLIDNGKTEIDYGATLQGRSISHMFTVKNTGNSDLILSNLDVPDGFILNGSFPNTIASGASVAFNIQLSAATTGSHSGTVQFNTNDSEKNPFSFTVKGFAGAAGQTTPIGTQLEVLEGGLYLQNEVGRVDFGTVWSTTQREILLYNTGATPLTLDNLDLPEKFVLRGEFPKMIEPNMKIPLYVEFNAVEEETYSGTMTFNSSDPLRSTVKIYLTATRTGMSSETTSPPPPINGTIEDNRSNTGNTMTDVTITSSGSISGGHLSGEIQNQGLIANVHVNSDGKVDGGKVSGYNINQGSMCNVEVSNYSKVDGGVYCGTVLNQGTLTDPKIEKDATVKGDGMLSGTVQNEGTVCGMRLDAGAQVVGGQLGCDIKGDETKPAIIGGQAQIQANTSLENVCITRSVSVASDVSLGSNVTVNNSSSGEAVMQDYCIQPQEVPKFDDKRVQGTEKEAFQTFDAANLAVLPEDATASLSAEQMGAFKKEALQGLQVNQFKQMSQTALSGLTKDNVGGFRAEVMQEMTIDTLSAIQPEALQQTEDFAKIATNVDLEKIKPQNLTTVLPENWQLDPSTGRLQPPTGSKISFKAMEKQELSSQVEMPMDMPDLSTSLAVGGRAIAGETVVEKLNQTLSNKGFGEFSLSQHTTGVVMVEGSSSSKDVSLALMPESDNMQQVDVGTQTSGISVDGTGRYLVTTEDGWQIPMVPAPQDVNDLATVLGTDSTVKVGKKGDVLMGYNSNQRRGVRDGDVYVYVVVIFDPFIDSTLLQEYCTATGCDWDSIANGLQPGLNYDSGNGRAKQQLNVVYSQGKAQKAYPTVLSPEDFMTEAKKFDGVESVEYNTDGSFTLVYQGQTLHLYPTTEVTATKLEQYETVKPSLTLQKSGMLEYSIQSGELLFTSSVVISE